MPKWYNKEKGGISIQNFRIQISYDGSRYQGWQRLGNGQTIQGKIEDVLSQMVAHKVEIHGAGRTDAGVHARAQVAHFKIQTDQSADEIQTYLNRYLPEDIAVTHCEVVDDRFHARLHATGKRYIYRIWNDAVPNVFERKYCYRMEEWLDVQAMQQAAAYLIGRYDFRAFCGNRKMKKSTVRTLSMIDIQRIGHEVRFIYEGTGFLQNMVRILTGTLVEVAKGQRTPEDMVRIRDSLDRTQAGITMPAQGLILDCVFYDSESR